MTRPNILVLTPTMPALTGGGLAMRIGLFVEALARIGKVDIVVVALHRMPDAAARMWLDRIVARLTIIDPRDRVDSHFALLARIVDPVARAEAFARYGRPSITARLSAAVAAEVAAAVADRQYDLVHVARTYLAPLALALPLAAAGKRTCLTLDADEDEARLARRQATQRRRQGDPDTARILDVEAVAYARLQAATLPSFDRIWASSPIEQRSLIQNAPGIAVQVIENGGTDTGHAVGIAPRCHRARPRLLFVGALGYGPNHDGLIWFLQRVWPRLRRIVDVDLDIVGAAPSEPLMRLTRRPGVHLHGFQPDLARFYRAATLVIAPLLTGAGTRIKIIEAAEHAVPVVATSLAAEGLPLRDGRDIWLADTPDTFATAVLDALGHPAKRQRIGRAGYRAIRRKHDRTRLLALVASEAEALLQKG